eukprot:g5075.t1
MRHRSEPTAVDVDDLWGAWQDVRERDLVRENADRASNAPKRPTSAVPFSQLLLSETARKGVGGGGHLPVAEHGRASCRDHLQERPASASSWLQKRRTEVNTDLLDLARKGLSPNFRVGAAKVEGRHDDFGRTTRTERPRTAGAMSYSATLLGMEQQHPPHVAARSPDRGPADLDHQENDCMISKMTSPDKKGRVVESPQRIMERLQKRWREYLAGIAAEEEARQRQENWKQRMADVEANRMSSHDRHKFFTEIKYKQNLRIEMQKIDELSGQDLELSPYASQETLTSTLTHISLSRFRESLEAWIRSAIGCSLTIFVPVKKLDAHFQGQFLLAQAVELIAGQGPEEKLDAALRYRVQTLLEKAVQVSRDENVAAMLLLAGLEEEEKNYQNMAIYSTSLGRAYAKGIEDASRC